MRYQETDGMGVVYHGNYINWFELGRTELIRQLGLSYRRVEELGLMLPVLEVEAKYHLPARYDDIIDIYTRIDYFDRLRMDFRSEIRRKHAYTEGNDKLAQPGSAGEPAGELLVSGGTRHVWVNGEWKPARLDRALRTYTGCCRKVKHDCSSLEGIVKYAYIHKTVLSVILDKLLFYWRLLDR